MQDSYHSVSDCMHIVVMHAYSTYCLTVELQASDQIRYVLFKYAISDAGLVTAVAVANLIFFLFHLH